jgi:hypothetical protein
VLTVNAPDHGGGCQREAHTGQVRRPGAAMTSRRILIPEASTNGEARTLPTPVGRLADGQSPVASPRWPVPVASLSMRRGTDSTDPQSPVLSTGGPVIPRTAPTPNADCADATRGYPADSTDDSNN